MAGAVIEVKYFNSFVLKKTVFGNGAGSTEDIVWNGSYGIPSNVAGGFPVLTGSPDPTLDANNWILEESRIRGGFNNVSTDYGAKAYLVEEDPSSSVRFNTLIYSGIFNSRTGVNNSNVFSVADDITKSADPANASIQKLYAEDTNLIIFQENKVSKALIDKDYIYTAEGNPNVTASNLTIGVITPYPGKFGISRNPESFAVFGFNKYFVDKNNNSVLRLGGSIDVISNFGMIDYFRDELNALDVGSVLGKVRGGYDIYNKQYIVSIQKGAYGSASTRGNDPSDYSTLSWDDQISGWTSLYDYRPTQIFSLGNTLYTTGKPNLASGSSTQDHDSLYQHYATDVNRGNFYGFDYPSTVTFVFNPNPSTSKNFKTISYEGMSGWEMTTLVSDGTGDGLNPTSLTYVSTRDSALTALSYLGGEYVINPATGQAVSRANYNAVFGTTTPGLPRFHAGFDRKENRYVTNLINNSTAGQGEVIFGEAISGIKGYFVTATLSTDSVTNLGSEKQLFAVGSDYVNTNGY